MAEELFNNSTRYRQEQNVEVIPVEPKPDIGQISVRKKPTDRKIFELIFGGTLEEVKDHALYDVIIPGIRDNIWRMLDESLQMLFYGKVSAKANRSTSTGSGTYVSYGQAFQGNQPVKDQVRANKEFLSYLPSPSDVLFESKDKALLVLDEMIDIVERKGFVPVAYLYDRANIRTNNWAGPNKWGWTRLGGTGLEKVRVEGVERYCLVFPKMVYEP